MKKETIVLTLSSSNLRLILIVLSLLGIALQICSYLVTSKVVYECGTIKLFWCGSALLNTSLSLWLTKIYCKPSSQSFD